MVSSDCLDAVFGSVVGKGLVVGGCGGLPPPPPPPPRSAKKEEGSSPLPLHIPQRIPKQRQDTSPHFPNGFYLRFRPQRLFPVEVTSTVTCVNSEIHLLTQTFGPSPNTLPSLAPTSPQRAHTFPHSPPNTPKLTQNYPQRPHTTYSSSSQTSSHGRRSGAQGGVQCSAGVRARAQEHSTLCFSSHPPLDREAWK